METFIIMVNAAAVRIQRKQQQTYKEAIKLLSACDAIYFDISQGIGLLSLQGPLNYANNKY